jgi:hypothetical protein
MVMMMMNSLKYVGTASFQICTQSPYVIIFPFHFVLLYKLCSWTALLNKLRINESGVRNRMLWAVEQ